MLRRARRERDLARRAELPTRGCCDVLDRVVQTGRPSGAPFYHLRDAGFDNISLDLIYGIPGQSRRRPRCRPGRTRSSSGRSTCRATSSRPKPGTRFTHAHGDELERQADAMESYFELGRRAADRAPAIAGTRPRTSAAPRASDCGTSAPGTTWPTGSGATTSVSGVGAVSTIGGRRWRNTPAAGCATCRR